MSSDDIYEFGPFRLESGSRSLFRAGEFVSLQPKAAEMLFALVESAGRVVTKEQLLERVWAGVVVEEGAIANNISALRKVLVPSFEGDGPIATISRRGYRFIAPVRALPDGPSEPLPASAATGSVAASSSATQRTTVEAAACRFAQRTEQGRGPGLTIALDRYPFDWLSLTTGAFLRRRSSRAGSKPSG